MISRPRGEIGVVVGLHLQAKQWQQAEVVFQAGSEALPIIATVSNPIFQKKDTSPTSLVSTFCQRSPATIPTFHVSSIHPSSFHVSFPQFPLLRHFSEVVASGEAAKAAELVPDIVSWKLGSREGINLVDGMNYMGKSMEHLAFVEIRDYDN